MLESLKLPQTLTWAAWCAGACVGLPAAGQTPGLPEIVNLWLVDAGNARRIAAPRDYEALDLPFLPGNLSIEAEADGDTRSVRFAIDYAPFSLENQAPYALGGDSGGNFHPVPRLRNPGWIRITATPYAAAGGGGVSGPIVTRNLYMRRTDFVVNSVADLHDAVPGDGQCAVRSVGIIQKPPGAVVGTPRPRECTLRAAIEEANKRRGRQTILLDGRGGIVYRLTLGELKVTDGLAIYGHTLPIIDAQRRSRLMLVKRAEGAAILVELNGLDLANGNAGSGPGDEGGVLRIENATVQMFGGRVRGGKGNYGGGIYMQNNGHAVLSGVQVYGNEAGNPASFGGSGVTQRGGGIRNVNGRLTIHDSAIFDNAAVRGGGISNIGGLVRIVNTTILDNEAASQGGGLENGGSGRMHISFSTITGNRAGTSTADPDRLRVGGGIYNTGTAFIASSVLAGNTDPFRPGNPHSGRDCYSPTRDRFKSYRDNLVGVLNANCLLEDFIYGGTPWLQHGTDAAPLDPRLEPRADLPLPHREPMAGSPLIDASAGSSIYPCPATDIRGTARPVGAGCDIGAVERR
jgi:CSLREA domain-containing protein